ncbi:MAG: nitroreductase family protein, partial [Burkholderiaceae bacterium]
VVQSPVLIVFCGNNRRHRQIMAWRNQAFVNDHLDAFFNAAVDAGIALSAFICAAEAAGLGCCPLSVIRNEAALVSELLGLPDQVFPVAGLALGWPSGSTAISKRLPLAATVHRNRFSDAEIKQQITEYDKWRSASQPFASQRDPARFGNDPAYGWSEDKARQYADPERADFGAFIRGKGFGLG